MNHTDIIKKSGGVALYGFGVAAELAKYGLHASSVVFSGTKNMTNHFVQAPDLKIGETLLSDTQKGVGNLARWLKKKGRGMLS